VGKVPQCVGHRLHLSDLGIEIRDVFFRDRLDLAAGARAVSPKREQLTKFRARRMKRSSLMSRSPKSR
jgi:hypothetical protein